MRRIYKSVAALVLALTVIVAAGLTGVYATSGGEDPAFVQEGRSVSYGAVTDADALFADYARKVLYEETGLTADISNGVAAGQRLSGDAKRLYDALIPLVKQVADGERASTRFYIGKPYANAPSGRGDAVDVYVEFDSILSLNQGDFDNFYAAFLTDLPSELYWHDKTVGITWQRNYPGQICMSFTVARAYRGNAELAVDASYVANTAKTGAAKAVVASAKAIVDANAGKSDYDKMAAYRDKICQLTSYDFDTLSYGNYSDHIDIWQLIHVFDNDPSTNVVCEGYSKAFMYLCDLSAFEGDVTCITVSGYMSGEAHMWNVVRINGKSYLVDVTNSDSGMVGQYGGLFLVGANGSPVAGYPFMGYRFSYRTDTHTLWGVGPDSILALDSSDYTPHTHNPVTDYGYAATCTVNGMTDGQHCADCGIVTTPQRIVYATGHAFDGYEDQDCNICGLVKTSQPREVTHMFRLYNPNTGEHFYTGSDVEKNNLVSLGWNDEGVGFSFPTTTGKPVHRLFEPDTGEHLYTMDEAEKEALMASGWNYEGVAFNSGFEDEVTQFRLHNPNETVGAYHFTASTEERDNLMEAGWKYQGIGWYSCWKGTDTP